MNVVLKVVALLMVFHICSILNSCVKKISTETAFYRRNAVILSVCPGNWDFAGEESIVRKIEKALSSVIGSKGKITDREASEGRFTRI